MTISLEQMRERRPGNAARQQQIKKELEAEVRAYRLAELRKRAYRTQVQMAKSLGVSQNRISKLENGDINHTEVDTLRRYVEALGGSIEVIVNIDEERYTLA